MTHPRQASLQAKTIPQLRDVVGKLGGLKNEHQTLRIRTALTVLIMAFFLTHLKILDYQRSWSL